MNRTVTIVAMNIPQAMRDVDRWIIWKPIPDPKTGKIIKKPLDPRTRRAKLIRTLRPDFRLRDHPDFESDWTRSDTITTGNLGSVRRVIGSGVRISRDDEVAALAAAVQAHTVTAVVGESGSGKSAAVSQMVGSPGTAFKRVVWLSNQQLSQASQAVRRWVASHASALNVGQTEAADGVHAGLLHPVEASRFVHTNTSIPERRARKSFTRLEADRSALRWNLARIREGRMACATSGQKWEKGSPRVAGLVV